MLSIFRFKDYMQYIVFLSYTISKHLCLSIENKFYIVMNKNGLCSTDVETLISKKLHS